MHTTVLVCFVPVYTSLGVMLTIVNCICRRRPRCIAEKKKSRTPLIKNKQSKKQQTKQSQKTTKKSHWWQFWRRRHTSTDDLEQGYGTLVPGRLIDPEILFENDTSPILIGFEGLAEQAGIDVSDIFPDFDGQPQQAVFEDPFSYSTSPSSFDSLAGAAEDIWLASTVARPGASFASLHPASTPPPSPSEEFAPYSIIRKLKHENQGKLFLVKYDPTGELYIIKQIVMEKNSRGRYIQPQEAKILSVRLQSSHPNILYLENSWVMPECGICNIIYEFCDAGDLNNLIESCNDRGEQVHPVFILHFFVGMIKSLCFLHNGINPDGSRVKDQPAICHADIKPANIFLRWSQNSEFGMPDIILGDFGLAMREGDKGLCGTRGYWPPEVEKYFDLNIDVPVWTKAGDMYGFGVTLFELISGKRYRPGDSVRKTVVTSSLQAYNPDSAASIAIMLEQCLAPNQDDRPRADMYLELSAMFEQDIREWYEQGGSVPDGMFPDPWYHDDNQHRTPAKPRQPKPATFPSAQPLSVPVIAQPVPVRPANLHLATDYSVLDPYTVGQESITAYSQAFPGAAAVTQEILSPYQLSVLLSSEQAPAVPENVQVASPARFSPQVIPGAQLQSGFDWN